MVIPAEAHAKKPLVIAMFKAPQIGFVKTRLGREIGMPEATSIYRQLAERQLQQVPEAYRTEIHFTPEDATDEMSQWLGPTHHYIAQCEGDLGEKMNHAFQLGFQQDHQRILMIGSDCPSLDATTLQHAADLLTTRDVVLGPATDGGYYLIGLRQSTPQLFEDIEWSTPRVLAQTLTRIRTHGLSHALLEEKEDIDDLAALTRHGGVV